eukprot:snap_masked-scaffold_40-processed-gene-2.37-mRNA-1 protein AED:1.00 eAED:1.00 QI:0/0/0/0/1/1/2/0/336
MKTDICELLGIEYPVLLAGMGGIAGKELVAEVSKSGGFGTYGSAVDVMNKTPEELLEELLEIKRMCNNKPFGVDLLVHGASGGVMRKLIKIFAEGGAKAFISGRGFPKPATINLFHENNMVVGSIAGKLDHAVRAAEAGVDFIIVQGYSGGGHTGLIELGVLLPQVIDAVNIPVIAAGGIYDGRGLASSLAYGASGVWIGTRFMLTPEANTHIKYKERLLKASSDETVVTKCYTGKRLRVLNNEYVREFDDGKRILENNSALIAKRAMADGCWILHGGVGEGYVEERQAYVVGQCIGAIDKLVPAGELVKTLVKEAEHILRKLQIRKRVVFAFFSL